MVDCQQTNTQCMFNISGELLKQKDFTRYLGVLTDDQLGAMQSYGLYRTDTNGIHINNGGNTFIESIYLDKGQIHFYSFYVLFLHWIPFVLITKTNL